MAFDTAQRPTNYHQLTSTSQAIIDDHIRAGIEPPKFEPFKPQHSPYSEDELDATRAEG